MTTTTPTTTTFEPPTSPSTRTRWPIALAAGTIAVAGIAAGFAIADGSDSDTPVTPPVERVVERIVEVVDEGAPAPVGPVSADAAERRAHDAAMQRCSGLSADAAERCMTPDR